MWLDRLLLGMMFGWVRLVWFCLVFVLVGGLWLVRGLLLWGMCLLFVWWLGILRFKLRRDKNGDCKTMNWKKNLNNFKKKMQVQVKQE
jgi:hypothetical protein